MTLFFNLENLEKEAVCDPLRFIALLHTLQYGVTPRKYKYVRPAKLELTGNSFLLNPKPLLENKDKIDNGFIIQYIKLAARRDYGLYKQYGVKSLLLTYFPDLNLQSLTQNPLLNIKQTEICFLYEEVKRK